MELAKVLFESIKESTLAYKEKNKNTSVVKLLDKAIDSIDTAIKAMDAFLKRKNVDIGKLYNDAKNSSKGFIERARESLEKNKSSEEGGLFKGLTNKGLEVGSSLLERFGKFKTSGTEPPKEEPIVEEKIEETPKATKGKSKGKKSNKRNPVIQDIKVTKRKDKEIKEVVEELKDDKPEGMFALLTSKLSSLAETIKTIKDGDPVEQRKQSIWDKWKERQDRRKKEVEEEKGRFGSKDKKGKDGGWLGKILGMGGTIVGGIMSATKFLLGGMITKLAPALVGGLVRGMGAVLTSLVPGLSSGLSSATGGLLLKGVKGAGKLVGRGLLAGATKALPVLGKAALLIGRGALTLLSGPVGWGIAAGTALYGAWRFYKYMTRNDISDNIYGKLTRLRLLSYGYNDDKKNDYSKMFELEMLLKENLKFDGTTGKLAVSKPNEEQIEKIYDIFKIEPDNKERKTLFNRWFANRFIPAFHAYVVALWKVNSNIYTDSLETLNPTNIERFLANYTIPQAVVDVKLVPYYEQPETTVTLKDIETIIAVIKNENKEKLPKDKAKPEERMARELASQRAKEAQAKTKAATDPSRIADKAVNTALTNAGLRAIKKPVTGSSLLVPQIGVEGESKPDIPVTIASPKSVVSTGPLKQATGPLMKGGTELVGITTSLKKEALFNLDPDLFNLFTGMAKEYYSLTGKSINVNEGFRSREEQEAIFKKYGPGRAAKPGKSMHEFGLAVDIPGATTRELDRLGLLRKYGFTASVGQEDWHIEPIGTSINYEKAKTDLEFRRQAILASPGRGGGGYGLTAGAKKYSRDIALQRAIYESNVTATPPEVKEALAGNLNNKATGPSTTSGPLSPVSQSTAPLQTAGTNTDTVKTSASPSIIDKSTTGGYAGSVANVTSTGSSIAGTSPTMDISKYGSLSPEEAVKQAAKMTGIEEETLLTFAKIESSLKTSVKNDNSSATGLFQITDDTWKDLVRKHGSKYGIPENASRSDPLYNALMAAEYAKENLRSIGNYEQLGLSKEVALYLTHHFGPSGGKNIIKGLSANPETPMKNLVSSSSYNSNQAALGGKTVKGYIDYLNNKFTVASNTPVEAYTGKNNSVASNAYTTPKKPTISNQGGYAASISTTKDDGFMKASYGGSISPTKPTISNSAYDITKIEMPSKADKATSSPISANVDLSSMENLMSQQLSTLTQIAKLISSIDSKLDIEKLTGILSGGQMIKETPQSRNNSSDIKTVPSTAVDLTRRRIT